MADNETPPTTSEQANTSSEENKSASVFGKLDYDEDINRMSELLTVCMNCHEEGTTRMLLTSIPYFRDIVVMSFECPHCHWKNNEIQPANELADRKVTFTLSLDGKLSSEGDKSANLDRQVIKSEYAVMSIPELDFEVPPNAARGEINTVEGIVQKFADALTATYLHSDNGLDADQLVKITDIVNSMKACAEGTKPFTFVISDPSGNSYIENPNAPEPDADCVVKYTERTREENKAMGYAVKDEYNEDEDDSQALSMKVDSAYGSIDTFFDVSKAVTLPAYCPECGNKEAETRMCLTDIPYFKEIIIMVSDCRQCGWKDSEVKPGGAVSEKACKISLKVNGPEDLKRDILKSDTGGIFIPEIELEMTHGTLGGKYTTVEGLLADIETQLRFANPFALGDSTAESQFGHANTTAFGDQKIVAFSHENGQENPEKVKKATGKMGEFLLKLQALSEGKTPFTFILDDPMSNCFIVKNTENPEDDDPALTIEYYERTHEQNEELGLNDIITENYVNALGEEVVVTEKNEDYVPKEDVWDAPKQPGQQHGEFPQEKGK